MRCKEIPTDKKSQPEIHARKIMLLIIIYNDNVEIEASGIIRSQNSQKDQLYIDITAN